MADERWDIIDTGIITRSLSPSTRTKEDRADSSSVGTGPHTIGRLKDWLELNLKGGWLSGPEGLLLSRR